MSTCLVSFYECVMLFTQSGLNQLIYSCMEFPRNWCPLPHSCNRFEFRGFSSRPVAIAGPSYLPITEARTLGFIHFPVVLTLCKMQRAMFRIWTLILFNDISTSVSHLMPERVRLFLSLVSILLFSIWIFMTYFIIFGQILVKKVDLIRFWWKVSFF